MSTIQHTLAKLANRIRIRSYCQVCVNTLGIWLRCFCLGHVKERQGKYRHIYRDIYIDIREWSQGWAEPRITKRCCQSLTSLFWWRITYKISIFDNFAPTWLVLPAGYVFCPTSSYWGSRRRRYCCLRHFCLFWEATAGCSGQFRSSSVSFAFVRFNMRFMR